MFFRRYRAILNNINDLVCDSLNDNELVIKRIVIPKLDGYGYIRNHTDSGDFLTTHWRCHFPLITNDRVQFFIGNTQINMRENHGYIINNQHQHRVANNSPDDRTHLIIDFGKPDD